MPTAPSGFPYTMLTIKAGDNRYRPNDYANWSGMRVGMIRASSRNGQFAEFAAQKGFRYEAFIYPTYREFEAALQSGAVDALVSTNTRRTKNEWVLEKINPDPIYIIVRKNNRKLLHEVNLALSILEINAPRLHETLTQRYYMEETADSIPLTDREAAFVDESKNSRRSFRTLIKPDRWPLADYRNGEIRGIFRDIAELVKQRSGLELRILPCRNRAEYDRILRSGDYDIIFDAWQNYPHAERNQLYLSEPYFSSSVSLLQCKNRSAETGKRGVLRNAWMVQELRAKGERMETLLPFDSTAELVRAVLDGTVDAAYMHTRMADQAVKQDISFRLLASIAYGLQTEYAIGVKRSLPSELIRIIGKSVRSISEYDKKRIVAAYEAPRGGKVSLLDWFAANPLKALALFGSFLIGVIGFLSFVIVSRRRMTRRGRVIAKLPVRFFVADREENILLFNAPDVAMLRKGVCKKLADVDVPQIVELMRKALGEAFAKGEASLDYSYGGTRRSARIERLSPALFGRETAVWISQNTEALQSSREQLRSALAQAQTAEREKSYFLATMSHEIRTPLNAVIGLSELLKEAQLAPEEQKEYLEDISSAGNALLALINDVLDLSKLEAGQMQFVAVETDFPALLREVIGIFHPRCRRKNLALSVHAQPMPHVEIDHLRVRQILFNLVGNAVKFTEHGAVTLTASFVPDGEGRGTLTFAVADTGIGIAEEEQKTLFEPFVQTKAIRGTQTANNGTGLGLAISRRMVAKMNGDIRLESAPGKGSVFTVVLRDIAFHEAPKNCEKKEDVLLERPIRASSILLVDDVAMNLKVMAAMLKKLGLTPVLSDSPAKALALLDERPFDIVFTDLWMPGMNGAVLAAKIRALTRFPAPRIVALTADVDGGATFDMSAFDEVMTKPVSLAKLRASLSRF